MQDRHAVCRQPEFEQAYQLSRQTLASQTSRKPAALMVSLPQRTAPVPLPAAPGPAVPHGLALQAHNLGTVAVLAELGANAACVSAALLHGVVDAGAPGSPLLHSLPSDVAMHVTNAARIADTSQVRLWQCVYCSARVTACIFSRAAAGADHQSAQEQD